MGKNIGGNLFLPHRDLNHGPLEPSASVLPMSNAVSIKQAHSGLYDLKVTFVFPVSGKINWDKKVLIATRACTCVPSQVYS